MTVIATAGHVDHGKSALVTAVCGTDPDRLPEEKRRGMTIELGFAHRVTDDGTVLSFVDVPGHSDFVRTMVAGVNGVGVALLVVDAGEGWMPQTEEHLGVLDVLGVRHGVVAVTRCDRVDATQISHTRADVSRRLAGSSVQWTDIIDTSAVTGEGVPELVTVLASLVAAVEVPKDPLGRPRLFVDRVFTMKGAGTVVTGTVDGSSLGTEDAVTVARTGAETRIRDVQRHGASVGSVPAGSRCALNLSSLPVDRVRRGDALVRSDDWWMTSVFDASFTTLASSRPLVKRDGYTLHVGTSDQSARVRLLGTERIEPGSGGLVRVRFGAPLPLTPGDRFLLRDPGTGTTVGGGTVLDVDPTERTGRAGPDGTVESQTARRGWIPVDEARRLTGRALEPVVGTWFAVDATVAGTLAALRARMESGPVDLTALTEWERLLVTERLGLAVDHGSVGDTLVDHPVAEAVRSGGVTPGNQTDRDAVRRLVQRGIVFEHDGIAFHRDVLDSLSSVLTELWTVHPAGFTVSVLRERLGITRKHAVPLAACLDKRGWTRRSGDLRVPGPRTRTGG